MPAVGKAVGRDVEHAHDQRLGAELEVAPMRQHPSFRCHLPRLSISSRERLCGLRRKNATAFSEFVGCRKARPSCDFRCALRARCRKLCETRRHHEIRILLAASLLWLTAACPRRRASVPKTYSYFSIGGTTLDEIEDAAQHARPAGEEHRPPASRRDADGVHHPARLRRTATATAASPRRPSRSR